MRRLYWLHRGERFAKFEKKFKERGGEKAGGKERRVKEEETCFIWLLIWKCVMYQEIFKGDDTDRGSSSG